MQETNPIDIMITLVIIVVVVVLVAGLLIGQNLRNERAMKVVAGEYTTTIVVPSGYDCVGSFVEANVFIVQCGPWR